jgi:hypothetical protein
MIRDSAKRRFARCQVDRRNRLRQKGGVRLALLVWQRSFECTLSHIVHRDRKRPAVQPQIASGHRASDTNLT